MSGGKCAEALQEVHARNKGSQESASFRDGSAEEGAVAEMDIAAFGVWGGFFPPVFCQIFIQQLPLVHRFGLELGLFYRGTSLGILSVGLRCLTPRISDKPA